MFMNLWEIASIYCICRAYVENLSSSLMKLISMGIKMLDAKYQD